VTNMKVKLGDGRAAEVESVEDTDLDQEYVVAGGKRLTEADAVELAEDIIRRHEPRRAGRPSLGKGRSPQVAFRIPAETKTRLAEVADRAGVRESDVLREALEDYLARH